MSVRGVKERKEEIWDLDKQWSGRILVGIDEVGRGPLAGPVVVCAAAVNPEFELFQKLVMDSKMLNENQRNWVYSRLMKNPDHCVWALGEVGPGVIDIKGMKEAIRLAVHQAATSLVTRLDARDIPHIQVIMDGNDDHGLKLPETKAKVTVTAVKKADKYFLCVGAASILAKEFRDWHMRAWSVMYPGYGFYTNKGYGTKKHYEALLEMGPCPIHRKTFIKKALEEKEKHSVQHQTSDEGDSGGGD